MNKKLLKLLIPLFMTFFANIAIADSLLRGFGVDALSIDDSGELAQLEDLIVNHNVNSFRVQYFNRTTGDDFESEPDKGVANYLNWVENTVLPHFASLKTFFDQRGVKTMFVLHSPIGGREESNPPLDRMFYHESLKQAQIEAWRMIAEVYNSDPNVVYQVFSEPGTTAANWKAFYRELVPAIREIGNTPGLEQPEIILMPPYGNPNLVSAVDITDLPEGKYALGVNMYSPFDFTHQGTSEDRDEVVSYPSSIVPRDCSELLNTLNKLLEKKKKQKLKKIAKARRAYQNCNKQRKRELKEVGEYNKEGLAKILQKAINVAEKKSMALYIPEYAVASWADGADKYLSDLGEVFDENNINSFYHILFEAPVWDPRMVCDRETQSCVQESTTDRLEALSEYFSSNEFAS